AGGARRPRRGGTAGPGKGSRPPPTSSVRPAAACCPPRRRSARHAAGRRTRRPHNEPMNRLKTTLLLGAMTGILLMVGELLAGRDGITLALLFAAVMNVGAWFFSD